MGLHWCPCKVGCGVFRSEPPDGNNHFLGCFCKPCCYKRSQSKGNK